MLKKVILGCCLFIAAASPAAGLCVSKQADFEADNKKISDGMKALQEERNQLALFRKIDDLQELDDALRVRRCVTNWSCTIEEVRNNSASYDRGLGTRRKSYHLVVCKGTAAQYFVLFDQTPTNAERLAKAEEGGLLKFSGTLGVFPKVASFHSSLLPPTFVVRANSSFELQPYRIRPTFGQP